MGEGCVFCKIIAGQIPGDILYKDDRVIAIRDINPQAPTHLLIMPREHIPSLAHVRSEQKELIGHLIRVAHELAGREGLAERGYRVTVNYGRDGGQLVPHLHFHLLGGRELSGVMG